MATTIEESILGTVWWCAIYVFCLINVRFLESGNEISSAIRGSRVSNHSTSDGTKKIFKSLFSKDVAFSLGKINI